ncbi:NAD(+) diphosphatase [Rhizobium sp. L1K21]|uniref:NAD(+) diphosphatase n=1 Tax=Rhizobium sp. L1K21 TaxID=2954933 RepID=UPI0020938211|nr:NAD(+) diphosphatase [Rhizobium sp. L1K21]MCO6187403.1 NAD(+) diphosphatase [Rhizobium sp. L1K21]
MTRSIFDLTSPHPEPSSLTAFSENALIRDSENRADDCLEKAFAKEGVLAYAIANGKMIFKHDRQVLDPLFVPYELKALDPDPDNAILLGFRENGDPRLAVPVNIDTESLPQLYKAASARTVYRENILEGAMLGEAAQAFSLVHWALTNRFCGKCGQKMEPQAGGYKRVCSSCSHMSFPRTDPVVIMLVIDEENDRCLLGRNHQFPEGMYSCLAGFVEPGETIENAVRRETEEESGISTGQVRIYASQPWPVPHSLMIGCYAKAKSLDIEIDNNELADCRWFSRQETEDMLKRTQGEPGSVPPKGAIAHRLMRDWLDWPE